MSFRTVSSSTSPLTESPSKSIQPSLKPSSIWTRGARFFMPCDLNRSSQDSRGTASMRTGECRRDIVRAHAAWPFQFEGPSAGPCFLEQLSHRPPDVRSGNHREWLVERLQKTRNHASVASQSYIPGGVLHKPIRAQKGNGYPQAAKCLLHQMELGEQIGAGCLRADCRDAHDLGRVCCLKGGPHGIGRSPRLWETRLWIEDRRREYEDAVRCLECRCERCRVIHLRQCQLTATF